MPTTISIATFATAEGGDFLDEFRVKFTTQVAERANRSGEIAKADPFKLLNEFSFKGGGDPAIAVGNATMTITGLTGGKKVIPDYELTQFNEKHCEYSASGKHYPSGA